MTLFEKISNTTVIIAAIAVVGVNVYDRFVPRPPVAQTALSRQYMGKRMPLPTGTLNGQKGTITLFVSKDCHFCSESMGFYQRLADLRSRPSCSNVKMVALGPKEREKREDLQAYLTSRHLSVDRLEMVDFSSVDVYGTPTLVLQDGARLVRGIWVGKLSESKENEVVAKVESFCQG